MIESLVIFRKVLKDKNMKNLIKILNTKDKSQKEFIDSYATFVHDLFKRNEDLTDYIWEKILDDENIYVLKKAENKLISPMIESCLENELNILQKIASTKSDDIINKISYNGFLPKWTNSNINFLEEYKERMNNISTLGYGIFAKNLMFTFESNELIPIKSPDTVRLSHLLEYENERKKVIDNTLSLINNKLSANVLLYGDAGTGKSSTVKAIVNEYGNLGLRLVEIRKNQLLEIPNLIETLSHNPLKFILYIDDLSFTNTNEEIGVLKAILEGSVAAKTSNIAIYATSNRRRLIKETFSERGNDDIHINETIQEQISLSERFGLSVGFFKPNKDEYLKIVFELAKQYQLKNTENLEIMAERHALERGGRSGRCARQFIEYLKSLE